MRRLFVDSFYFLALLNPGKLRTLGRLNSRKTSTGSSLQRPVSSSMSQTPFRIPA